MNVLHILVLTFFLFYYYFIYYQLVEKPLSVNQTLNVNLKTTDLQRMG